MRIRPLHAWDMTPAAACAIQAELRAQVRLRPLPRRMRAIAGVDMALDPRTNMGYAGIVTYTYPALEETGRRWATQRLRFPYVPGLLSFREGPLLLRLFAKLDALPDVILCDGQGIAHPRGMGIASHMGVWLNVPTIGVAKSRLYGAVPDPCARRGSVTWLRAGGARVGAVVRTRDQVKPVYVSPGHLADCPGAVALVLRCCDGLRVPRPTRDADHFVAALKPRYWT